MKEQDNKVIENKVVEETEIDLEKDGDKCCSSDYLSSPSSR